MSNDEIAVDGAQVAPAENAEIETEQTSTPAETESPDTPEPELPRDDKGRFVPQERVNEITRARRQAERERDEYRTKWEQSQTQTQPAAQSEKPPTPEDFGYDLTAFGAALTEHTVKQARAQAAQEFSQRQQQASQAQLYSQFGERERPYAAANPGYEEAVQSLASNVRFDPSTLEVIAESEHGPAVLHHLAAHLDVADRIARMHPVKAAYEIAKLEAQVTAQKVKPVSKAPSPSPTLTGGSANKSALNDDLSADEWLARRRAQLKK